MFTKEAIALAKPFNEALGKLGWKWEPEPYDWIIFENELHCLFSDGKRLCYRPKYDFGRFRPLSEVQDKVTPFLHWERIREILVKLGYKLHIGQDRKFFGASIFRGKKCLSTGDGESWQAAVMRAVCSLSLCYRVGE